MSFNHVLIKIWKDSIANAHQLFRFLRIELMFQGQLGKSSLQWTLKTLQPRKTNNLGKNSNKKYKAGQREEQMLPGAGGGLSRELLARAGSCRCTECMRMQMGVPAMLAAAHSAAMLKAESLRRQ